MGRLRDQRRRENADTNFVARYQERAVSAWCDSVYRASDRADWRWSKGRRRSCACRSRTSISPPLQSPWQVTQGRLRYFSSFRSAHADPRDDHHIPVVPLLHGFCKRLSQLAGLPWQHCADDERLAEWWNESLRLEDHADRPGWLKTQRSALRQPVAQDGQHD